MSIASGEDWAESTVELFRDSVVPQVPTKPDLDGDNPTADTWFPVEEMLAAPQGSAQAMISECGTLIGTSEHPPGSNHNFITNWYGFDGSWCDMAVSFAAYHSGNADAFGGKFAYVPAHAAWFKNRGLFHYGNGSVRDIKPGDVVFYEWSGKRTVIADHVGICVRNNGDGTIYSDEGNTQDVDARRHRDGTYIAGWATPRYRVAGGGNGGTPNGGKDVVEMLKEIKMGDNGLPVKILQVLLNDVWQEGSEAKLIVDSAFGPATDRRVKQEQSQHGLVSDGVVGPKTWGLLLDAQ